MVISFNSAQYWECAHPFTEREPLLMALSPGKGVFVDLSPGEAPAAAAAAWEGQQVECKENSGHSELWGLSPLMVAWREKAAGKCGPTHPGHGLNTAQKRGEGTPEGWEITGAEGQNRGGKLRSVDPWEQQEMSCRNPRGFPPGCPGELGMFHSWKCPRPG